MVVPLLKKEGIALFRGPGSVSRKLRANMIRSLDLMLDFYGFRYAYEKGEVKIVRSSSFKERSQNWLQSSNHNFLRVTRILESLRLVGLTKYAVLFFNALSEVHEEYGQFFSLALHP